MLSMGFFTESVHDPKAYDQRVRDILHLSIGVVVVHILECWMLISWRDLCTDHRTAPI